MEQVADVCTKVGPVSIRFDGQTGGDGVNWRALNSAANESRAEHRTSLRVETACEFSAVRAGVTHMGVWLGELGLPEADLGAWELALTEAGNNAVKYSKPEAREQSIVLNFPPVPVSWRRA